MTNIINCVERYGTNAEKVVYYQDGTCIVKGKQKNISQSNVMSSTSNLLKKMFLPQGYPESVSDDYLQYQLWDTMQAFCSSVTGILATQAVLKAYGVGDNKATAAGATITWMLKDGAGMIGRILFAWKKGTQLDCDAKRWRLVADILNDCAIMMDLIAPLFKTYILIIASISSVARAIVGVAGGATRAALTLHQARRNNMADVSAKDGSQETLVNLMALIAGFVITPLVADNQFLVWNLFFLFTFLHLYSNYQAVSVVVMETINLPRLFILLKHYIIKGDILSPKQINKLDPVLRTPGYKSSINIACSYQHLLKSDIILDNRLFNIGFNERKSSISAALNVDVSNYSILECSAACLIVDMFRHNIITMDDFYKHGWIFPNQPDVGEYKNIPMGLVKANEHIFSKFAKGLEAIGWNLKQCHLNVDEWRMEYRLCTKEMSIIDKDII